MQGILQETIEPEPEPDPKIALNSVKLNSDTDFDFNSNSKESLASSCSTSFNLDQAKNTFSPCDSTASSTSKLWVNKVQSITIPGNKIPILGNNNSPSKIAINRFPVSERSREFLKKFYPDATIHDWNNWKWQVRNRIRKLDTVSKMLNLTADEKLSVEKRTGNLPIAVTPYYMSLLSVDDSQQPLRKTHIPVGGEFITTPGEDPDPLGEDHDTATPGLVHRYPDRVLFLTTGFCSTYCRYCTRSRMVGETNGEYSFSVSQWERAAQYIDAHPEIRDCLLSGGDPLSIGDDKLEFLLKRLRSIKHLDFIRIGTKIPVVMPQRITKNLTRILKKYHPLWMSIHFTHPDELTPETIEACNRLADAGIPLGSQTVLLKGVNDDINVMKPLMHGLLKARVKPYYLYQCDPVAGSAHFRTPVEKGLEIIRQLRGHTTGYAVPQLVVDAPGGGGKIPILPDYIVGRDGDDLLLTNFENGTYRYPDPGGKIGLAQNALRDRGYELDMDIGLYKKDDF